MNIWYDLVLSALGPTALVPTALGHTRYSSLGQSVVSMQTSSWRVLFAANDDDDDDDDDDPKIFFKSAQTQLFCN